jgi:hypothetical protein
MGPGLELNRPVLAMVTSMETQDSLSGAHASTLTKQGLQLFSVSVKAGGHRKIIHLARLYMLTSEVSLPWVCFSVDFIL